MAVRKDKNGRWYIDLRYKDENGQWRKCNRSTGPDTGKREAERLERKLKAELKAKSMRRSKDLQPQPSRKSVPFSGFAKKFMDGYVMVHNRPSEQATKESMIGNHLYPYFGDRPLDKIRTEDIQRFMGEKLKEGYATSTVNNLWGVLSKLFNCAVDWGYLDTSPMRGVKKLKEQQAEVEFYTEAETARFLRVCQEEEPFWFPFFLVAFLTGLRLGELCGLKWKDIDFGARVIHIRRSIWRGVEGPPKSGKPRTVPIHEAVMQTLLQLQCEPDAWVFTALGGTQLTRNSIRKPMRRVQDAAGLRPIHFHAAGRHSFTSQLVMQGQPMKLIQALLGHSTSRMTDRYAHLSPNLAHDAVGRLLGGAIGDVNQPETGADIGPNLGPNPSQWGRLRRVK